MGRLVRALILLVVIDALLGVGLRVLLQILPREPLCVAWASLAADNADKCDVVLQGDLLNCLRLTLIRIMAAPVATGGVWLLVGYGIHDWGTPGGLRRKTPIWWFTAAASALGAGLLAYWQPPESNVLAEGARIEVSLIAVAVAVIVYCFSTVLVTPRVLLGQVPGGTLLMRPGRPT